MLIVHWVAIVTFNYYILRNVYNISFHMCTIRGLYNVNKLSIYTLILYILQKYTNVFMYILIMALLVSSKRWFIVNPYKQNIRCRSFANNGIYTGNHTIASKYIKDEQLYEHDLEVSRHGFMTVLSQPIMLTIKPPTLLCCLTFTVTRLCKRLTAYSVSRFLFLSIYVLYQAALYSSNCIRSHMLPFFIKLILFFNWKTFKRQNSALC